MSEQETPEPQTAAAEPGTGDNGELTPQMDPFEGTTEELRAKIEAAMESGEPETKLGDPPAEVEETPSEPVEVSESTDTPAADATGEPDSTEEKDLTEADELRAMLEVAESDRKHFESLLGGRAGEDGFFKTKATQLEREMAELRQKLDAGTAEPSYQDPPQPQPQSVPQADNYLVELAVQNASQSFFAANPDAKLQTDADFAEAVKANAKQLQDALSLGDPRLAAAETTRLLSGAQAKVDSVRKRARLDEIRTKRAEQGTRLKDKKRASAAASAGTSSGTPAKRRIDPMKIPMEELRELAEAEARAAGEERRSDVWLLLLTLLA